MDILWAGWRSAYISSLGEPAADCLSVPWRGGRTTRP
jgi:hypothetical protein